MPLTKSPAVQIHYNGFDHWVTSVSVRGNVYFLDSLYKTSPSINMKLDIQLAAMYGLSGKDLEIKVPNIQQQMDFNQCGVFAIANAVEFSFTRNPFWEKSKQL